MAKVYATEIGQRDRGPGGADLRRLRLLARVRGRALLPGRSRDDDLRRHERDPADRDLQERAGGAGTMTEPEDPSSRPRKSRHRNFRRRPGASRQPAPSRRLEEADELEATAAPEAPAAQTVTGAVPPPPRAASRPELIDAREPLYRECKGYRLRLDPPDLARLRELAGSRGKIRRRAGRSLLRRTGRSPRRIDRRRRGRARRAARGRGSLFAAGVRGAGERIRGILSF